MLDVVVAVCGHGHGQLQGMVWECRAEELKRTEREERKRRENGGYRLEWNGDEHRRDAFDWCRVEWRFRTVSIGWLETNKSSSAASLYRQLLLYAVDNRGMWKSCREAWKSFPAVP